MHARSLTAAALAILFSTACSASDLMVTASNLHSDQGQVIVCVFSAENTGRSEFPDCVEGHSVRSAQAAIIGRKAVIKFDGLTDGVYAVAIVHDENGNGKLDTDFLGRPDEGVGLSNNPWAFGRPKFEHGQFTIKGNTAITIDTKYLL